MIKTKINKETLLIPTFKELTVKQYAELIESERDIKDYLRITTGKQYNKILESTTLHLDHLINLIGTEPILKFKSSLILEKIYKVSKKDTIKTLGQRLMINEYSKKHNKRIDVALFILALILTKSYDYDEVVTFQKKLYKYSYVEVLPTADFFLANFLIGQSKELNYLQKLKARILISIWTRRRRLVWMN